MEKKIGFVASNGPVVRDDACVSVDENQIVETELDDAGCDLRVKHPPGTFTLKVELC